MYRIRIALIALIALVAGPARAEIQLPVITATANHYVEFDLRKHSGMADAEFKLVSGPGWVKITEDGVLVGKPQDADVGGTCIHVEVSYDGNTVTLRVRLEVKPDNHVQIFKAAAYVNRPFSLDLRRQTGVVAGLWSAKKCAAWLAVNPRGFLLGVPAAADVGASSCFLEVVTPKGETHEFEALIEVRKEEPVPGVMKVPAGRPFTFNLRRVFGEGIYSLMTAPAFASLSEDGMLVGKPAVTDIGDHALVIKVLKGADVELHRFRLTVTR